MPHTIHGAGVNVKGGGTLGAVGDGVTGGHGTTKPKGNFPYLPTPSR